MDEQLAHLRPYLLPAWERLKVETDLTSLEVVLDREARNRGRIFGYAK